MGLWQILKGEQPGIIETILNYENKGQFGEYLTNYALNHDNLPGYLKTICNLYIPHKNTTTEIDVLMIHEKGIFVFESKNYSGWIFGSADALKWTQCLPNKEKKQFYNPVRQNSTHIKALADFLHLPEEAFTSFIIFSERCELKNVPDDTASCIIIRRPRLLKNLINIFDGRQIRYSHSEVDALAETLGNAAHASEQEKKQHVESIKDRTTGTVCPFCGARLILRKGKFGDFYGCSAYPKCKFTRKV